MQQISRTLSHMTDQTHSPVPDLKTQAYDAFDRGDLHQASRLFESLLQQEPGASAFHYMRGLAHKYLLDWPLCLHHNLRAIEVSDGDDEAYHWNAAMAATALGQWDVVRRLWKDTGINIEEGEGPIHNDFGLGVVRLTPWQGGETVWVRRIDPVRARILNVPTPETGHRFGDIVLHDGASTGSRFDADGRKTHVFNELARLHPSDFQTFVVFVSCENTAELGALLEATGPGIGFAEDWTSSLVNYCLRCSYGVTHRHEKQQDAEWQRDRNLGIAAQSRLSVEKLLSDWAAAAPERYVESIQTREMAAPALKEAGVWWRAPEDSE